MRAGDAAAAMRRANQPEEEVISTRQRLLLFSDTGVAAEDALGFSDEELNAGLLIESGVKAGCIAAAGIGPAKLREMGVADAATLRRMGFDPLYLVDSRFCAEANAAFGAVDVKAAFLSSASDAVCLAGSDAVHILSITGEELLDACAGASVEAFAVLQQMQPGQGLAGVSAGTLLNTGLRKQKLLELGYSISNVVAQTQASAPELQKLGFCA